MLTRINGKQTYSKTMSAPGFIRPIEGGVNLAVKVQPRASANEIVSATGDELRIRINAAPVDAAANEALVRFLARVFECPRSQVELLRGNTSRHKVLKIHGKTATDVLIALAKSIGISSAG